MGIYDRDYMKRRPDDGGDDPSRSKAGLETFFERFLERHPHLFRRLGIGLVVLVIIALIVAKISGKHS